MLGPNVTLSKYLGDLGIKFKVTLQTIHLAYWRDNCPVCHIEAFRGQTVHSPSQPMQSALLASHTAATVDIRKVYLSLFTTEHLKFTKRYFSVSQFTTL